MDFHHPLIQSVVLPALLALGLCAGLKAIAGQRWAAGGTALALLLTSIWVLGWPLRWGSLLGALPWVLLGAGVLGVVLQAARADAKAQWIAMALLWAVVLLIFGSASPWLSLAAWLVGAVVLGMVASARSDTADAPAVLALAGLGLAAVAMLSASLLIFELALGGALALAGTALWLWPRARIDFGPAGRTAAAMAWLTLAYATARLTQAPVLALLLLALGFGAAAGISRWPRVAQPLWARPLWCAAPMALCVAAALAVTLSVGSGEAASTDAPGSPQNDDPYYTPRW